MSLRKVLFPFCCTGKIIHWKHQFLNLFMLSWRRTSIRSSLLKPIPLHILWNGWMGISNSSLKSHTESEIQSPNHKIKHLANNGFFDEALDLYQHLRVSDAKPDRFTFTKYGFAHNIFVMNSVLEMYSRFGSSASARRVFDEMPKRNLFSWNLMISCYGKHGYPLKLCSSMKHIGMTLDKVGLKIVLPICGHAKAPCGFIGFVHGNRSINCSLFSMVDLIGRAGFIDEAFEFICEMPMEPDYSVVGAFLRACRIHGHLEMGRCLGRTW